MGVLSIAKWIGFFWTQTLGFDKHDYCMFGFQIIVVFIFQIEFLVIQEELGKFHCAEDIDDLKIHPFVLGDEPNVLSLLIFYCHVSLHQ
jgi:hypothetical protein